MYDHARIDKKWQEKWEELGVFHAEDFSKKEKFYCLIEFPYPSGAGLHTGHPRSYTALDIIARQARLLGKNVLYPIGWDAFGLPTENYAIKTGRPPQAVTAENIATFKRQIKSLGLSFDWSREINTTDPEYYKWTQWQFLQFFKQGLAYKQKMPINWCPQCKIGLANEEAVAGACERCGGVVAKRDKEQWMIGITRYADRLLADLDQVNYLPQIKKQQTDWIGRSEGAEIDFVVDGTDKKIRVFTTRPDTLFGATYLVLAPEHPLVGEIVTATQKSAVAKYVAATKNKTDIERGNDDKEKTGEFTGAFVVNPANEEKIPVWVADYVMMNYGTGAIMAVPAHDERDFAFAQKYNLAVRQVVAPYFYDSDGADQVRPEKSTVRRETAYIFLKHWSENKYLCLDWKNFGWHSGIIGGIEEGEDPAAAAAREIIEETGYKNFRLLKKMAGAMHNYFYAAHKDVNRYAVGHQFVFELVDDAWVAPAPAETKNHEAVWIGAAALPQWLNMPNFIFAWEIFTGKRSECFSGAGMAVNSGFLNDLTTPAAAEKIITWLAEKNLGASKTTYKLRDWIFSRQRYWGEPIPLVHCDACAARKQKVLLIHGLKGGADKFGFPYLRRELTAAGFEVLAPTMSTADNPDLVSWMKELQPYLAQLGEQDIILGHSIGGKAALHLIEQGNKKIGHLFLLAPAVGYALDDQFSGKRAELAAKKKDSTIEFLEAPLNWEKINSLVGAAAVISSADDDRVPPATHEFIPAGWQIWSLGAHGHFINSELPEVLAIVARAKNTGWVALAEKDLPMVLPEIKKYEPTDNGESPLAAATDWVNTKCPRCGGAARRETDTMPNWAGSSWYFWRYADAHNTTAFAAPEKLKYWLPVDLYNGGMEHTTLHLLYSRFWNKFFFDLGYAPTAEPYARRTSHGLILAEDGNKMSKSKGNVVNPDEIVAEFGADTMRLYEMFIGPFAEPAPWSTNGLVGVKRFLDRVAGLPEKIATDEDVKVTRELHRTIKKITSDIADFSFNTAVAQFMIFVNEVYAAGALTRDSLEKFLLVLNPFAPHLTEELWAQLGNEKLICQAAWPSFDAALLQEDTFELVVQINGKIRDRLTLATGATEEEMKAAALASPAVQKWLASKEPRQIIVVPGRLVNLVL